jgi:hypothetical protein
MGSIEILHSSEGKSKKPSFFERHGHGPRRRERPIMRARVELEKKPIIERSSQYPGAIEFCVESSKTRLYRALTVDVDIHEF